MPFRLLLLERQSKMQSTTQIFAKTQVRHSLCDSCFQKDQGNLFLALAAILNLGNVELAEDSAGSSFVASVEELKHVSVSQQLSVKLMPNYLFETELPEDFCF